MKRDSKPRSRMQARIVAKNCPFCQNKFEPSYKEVSALEKYLTERGKILTHTKTGICSKHQRALTREVKRARHVSLLPFVVRV